MMLAVNNTTSGSTGLSTNYAGATASGLNQLLANPAVGSIRVTGAALMIDQPIEIRRSGVSLNLGSAPISSTSASAYMLRVANATDVWISGGNFVSGGSAILVNNSRRISVTSGNISNLKGVGIVVTGSDHVSVTLNHISGLQLSGVMIHRGTTSSYIARNSITGNLGSANLMAGIVLTDREVDVTANPRTVFDANLYGAVVQPITSHLHPPHDNVMAFNHVSAIQRAVFIGRSRSERDCRE